MVSSNILVFLVPIVHGVAMVKIVEQDGFRLVGTSSMVVDADVNVMVV